MLRGIILGSERDDLGLLGAEYRQLGTRGDPKSLRTGCGDNVRARHGDRFRRGAADEEGG
jgi:hypothetical protein